MGTPIYSMAPNWGGGADTHAQALADQTLAPVPAQPNEFDVALSQGFRHLRFTPALEARFEQDKAAERQTLLSNGVLLLLVLSNTLLLADWLMIHDQFNSGLLLRLGLFTPVCLLWLSLIPRQGRAAQEWSCLAVSLLGAGITVYLCLCSTDPLAAPYLVCLSLIQLFNGGVIRMRFWIALKVDALVLLMFAGALLAIPDPPWNVMISLSLVLVSTTVFTLFGSYWLEHDERGNWLMLQQERVLLEALGQANLRLDELSRFDALTGLANRRQFDEFLQRLWPRARQDGQELALLMIDVDHFKAYNDHYGHPAGDVCLKAVADALKSHLRKPEDLVARLGGEEFIVVLSKSTLPMALAAAERVREGVASLHLPHLASATATNVTVSVGVAAVVPGQAVSTPAQLVDAADAALYQAKSRGRNRVFAQVSAGAQGGAA